MQVFVAMAFQDKVSENLYHYSVKPVCEKLNLKAVRADEIFSPNPILDDIVGAIETSKVIIADITGRNANVFYELGISHTLKRNQTIMITRDISKDIPFDVAHFRVIRYDDSIAGKAIFENSLEQTLRVILEDPRILREDEFRQTERIFEATENLVEITNLVARRTLASSPEIGSIWCYAVSVPHMNERLEYVGNYDEETFTALQQLGFVEPTRQTINLTPSGEAFADLLIKKGYQCVYVNGKAMTKEYSPSDFILDAEAKRTTGERLPYSRVIEHRIRGEK
jgi:hypothetical protein